MKNFEKLYLKILEEAWDPYKYDYGTQKKMIYNTIKSFADNILNIKMDVFVDFPPGYDKEVTDIFYGIYSNFLDFKKESDKLLRKLYSIKDKTK